MTDFFYVVTGDESKCHIYLYINKNKN